MGTRRKNEAKAPGPGDGKTCQEFTRITSPWRPRALVSEARRPRERCFASNSGDGPRRGWPVLVSHGNHPLIRPSGTFSPREKAMNSAAKEARLGSAQPLFGHLLPKVEGDERRCGRARMVGVPGLATLPSSASRHLLPEGEGKPVGASRPERREFRPRRSPASRRRGDRLKPELELSPRAGRCDPFLNHAGNRERFESLVTLLVSGEPRSTNHKRRATLATDRGGRSAVLRPLHNLLQAGVLGDRSDGELLREFMAHRKETAELAFTALVGRHGAMVWRVCRSVLTDPHEAEDAFQATFLVLVQHCAVSSPAGFARKLAVWRGVPGCPLCALVAGPAEEPRASCHGGS